MSIDKIIEKIKWAEKKIYVIRYVLEFIFFLISIVAIYKVITIKQLDGYYHKTYLIIGIMYMILSIACLIYCCYKDKNVIEKMFLTFMIPVGTMYLVFVLPGQVPDESAHLWKAYEISKGILITPIEEDGTSHTNIPKDLYEYQQTKIDKYSDLRGKVTEQTNYNDTVQVISSAQNYAFVLYIGSALGFLIARICGVSILIGIFLGKIFNFIIFLALGYYAIKTIPFGKILLAAYLFMPMVIHQQVSFSADSITNSVFIVFIAYILKLIFQDKHIERKQQICLIALSCLVGIVKTIYVPFLGLILMLAFKKNMSKKEKVIVIPTAILVGIIVAIVMYIISMQYISLGEITGYNEKFNVNTSEQVKYIIKNPDSFANVIIKDWETEGCNYMEMLVGIKLGSTNIEVNRGIIMLIMFTVLFSAFVEDNKQALNKKQKLWVLMIGIGTILIIETFMFISWSGAGSTVIYGIQGRYFIPVIITILLTMCMKNNYIKIKNITLKIPIVLSILNLFAINAVYKFFIA